MPKFGSRSSEASKKLYERSESIVLLLSLWLLLFLTSRKHEPKNCPSNRAKARFNRVWA